MRTVTVTELNLISQLSTTRQGRECDPKVILGQIGLATVLAVSGGRYVPIHDSTYICGVLLIAGTARAVEVILDYNDTYSVRRTRLVTSGKAKGQVVVESETSGVYCDQLTEVVWSTSCWK